MTLKKEGKTKAIDIVINTIIILPIIFNNLKLCLLSLRDYYYYAIIIIAITLLILLRLRSRGRVIIIIIITFYFYFSNTNREVFIIFTDISWYKRMTAICRSTKENRSNVKKKKREREREARKGKKEMMTMKYVPMYLYIIYWQVI